MKQLAWLQQSILTLALLATPLSVVSAQGGGGRGAGGGMGGGGASGMIDMTGMGGGGFGNMAPRPLHYDLDGPFSFDSFRVLLTLDSIKYTRLQEVRTAHLAATAVLRDSVKVKAVDLGLTTATAFSLTALSKPELSKAYALQLKELRKQDTRFFEKVVRPELTKEQFNALKTWYGQQRPIGQAARGGAAGQGQGRGEGRGEGRGGGRGPGGGGE